MKRKQQARPVCQNHSGLNNVPHPKKANGRKSCLLAAIGGVAAMFPSVGHAQVPTPYLDLTASGYNPVSGVWTPSTGPAGIVLESEGANSIKENSTVNGTSAVSFSGSSYFQIYNTANGTNTTLLSGNNITILAFVASGAGNGNSTIVGGPSYVNSNTTTGLQFRLESGATTGDLAVLAGGRVAFGSSPSVVPIGTAAASTNGYSSVGVNANLSSGSADTYYLNGSAIGTSGATIAGETGFDRVGARDGGEYFTGTMEEIQVYNSVLTTAQIAAATAAFNTAYNTVSNNTLYYSGANSGNFDTSSNNFTLGGSSTAVNFAAGNAVIFQDFVQGSGAGINNPNISIQSGGVAPSSVTFNNQSVNYTLSDSDGVNGITGSTGLTKNYAGSLTLNGSNSYTGPTILNGGPVYVNTNGAFGSTSSITIAGAAVSVGAGLSVSTPTASVTAGTLLLQSNSSFTASSGMTISGSGSVQIADGATLGGAGTLSLNTSTFGSLTTVVANPYSTATVSMPINVGAFNLTPNISSGTLAVTGGITGTGGVTLTTATGGMLAIGGVASYTGATNIQAGALEFTGPGTSTLTGTFGFGGNGVANSFFVTGGTINFTNANRIDTGAANVNQTGNIVVSGGALNITGALSVGDTDYGELTVSNGAVNLPGVLALGYPAGNGTLSMTGGTLTLGSPLAGVTIGSHGTTGTMNLDGGLVVATTVQGVNSGVLNFNGGTLQASSGTPVFISGLTSAFIYAGGATINDGGAAVTIPQSLLTPSGLGISNISFGSVGSGYSYTPIVHITGGTLATGGVGATATAVFNPATGQVTGVNITNPGNYTSTTGLTFTFSGGGTTTSVTAPSGATFSSAANTGGGLTKTGSGILTLTGTNTYSGPTNITAGTLQVASIGA
jgi:fibronectin-binding autotransporter adhesin